MCAKVFVTEEYLELLELEQTAAVPSVNSIRDLITDKGFVTKLQTVPAKNAASKVFLEPTNGFIFSYLE